MENCEKTDGICILDKNKRLVCKCPEGMNYDDSDGCRGKNTFE